MVDLSSPVVPQITDKILDAVRVAPCECVQNHTRKLFVDVPVPHIKELPRERVQNRVTLTGKVFTVRHNIKGVDKYNMLRPGDVMVPVPQINQGIVGHVEQVVSWFDRKYKEAPLGEPLYRFQSKSSRRTSHSKLKSQRWCVARLPPRCFRCVCLRSEGVWRQRTHAGMQTFGAWGDGAIAVHRRCGCPALGQGC